MEQELEPLEKVREEEEKIQLKQNLERLLEKELEKSPNEINVERIDAVISLLAEEKKRKEDVLTKEVFSNKYLQDFMRNTEKEKRYGIFISGKVAAILIMFLIIFGTGNHIVVKATGQGILANIKRKADIFYFDFVKNKEEMEEYTNLQEDQEIESLAVKEFSSWETLKEEEQVNFRVPKYIPKKMDFGKIQYLKIPDSGFELSRSYENETAYIRLHISAYGEEGKTGILSQNIEHQLYEKRIGDYVVTTYQGEGYILAFFEEGQTLYTVETNLEEEELEYFIEEMK